MTDDERIQRLTELARRVWPGHAVLVDVVHRLGTDTCGYGVRTESGSERIKLMHPRALDALEAALLALVGKDEPLVKEQAKDVWSEGFETAKRMFTSRPQWVEQLASEWEREADSIVGVPGVPRGEAPVLRMCAEQLRERAKDR